MSSINTNLAGMMAQRSLSSSQGAIAKAMEHLATGKRINRGADDPAGLITADRLGAQRVSLEEIIKKATHAGAMLDTADGALGSIEDLLTDLNGRIVQAANTAVEGAHGREALQVEADSALETIQRIIGTT